MEVKTQQNKTAKAKLKQSKIPEEKPEEITVEVRQLSKAYNTVRAAEQIDFSVRRGEIVGLLGANGAGKSTVIECILGTKRPDHGTVSILEKNPETERKQIFERVGVQFQEASYQEKITVEELCRVTAALYNDAGSYVELLKQFGISDKAKAQISQLSGGQKQRLFIVLALIPNPEVVFLDELTTGLDAKARRNVWKCLANLKIKGLTMILTSHFMDEVEALCDRIMILKKGKSVFCGTVSEAVEFSPFHDLEEAYLWYTEEEENENEGIPYPA